MPLPYDDHRSGLAEPPFEFGARLRRQALKSAEGGDDAHLAAVRREIAMLQDQIRDCFDRVEAILAQRAAILAQRSAPRQVQS